MENLTETSKIVDECETKMDIPGSLPIEIFHEVLLYLSSQDLQNACKCCEKWKNHMESFWKRKCKIEHYFECKEDLNSKFYRNFMEKYSYWEGIYMFNTRLRENWINLNYKEIVVQHDFKHLDSRDLATSIVYYISDDVIISTTGTIEKDLLVINCITGVVENRIFPPFNQTSGVVSIGAVEIMENQLIVVWKHIHYVEFDHLRFPIIIYLTVWNINTGELLIKLKREFFKNVCKVIIYKDLVMVITDPCGAYIFNIKTGSLDYEQCDVSSACHYNDTIILGNQDGTILIMDLDYTKLMTLKCCTNEQPIINTVVERNYLVCGYKRPAAIGLINYRWACIWNIKTKSKLYELQNVEHINDIALFVNENKMCYSTYRGNFLDLIFKLCDLDTGECLFQLYNSHYRVFANNFLIIQRDGDDRHSLKMWSIKTRELVADLDTSSSDADKFFYNRYIGTMKTKAKIADFRYKSSWGRLEAITLHIIDFQAKLEV